MTAIRSLLPKIAMMARGCPTPVLMKAYLDAARDFCGQTRWLRDALAPLSTQANVAQYVMTPTDAATEIVGVKEVWITDVNGNQWQVGPQDQTQWNINAPANPPQVYAYAPESAIALYYTPDVSTYSVTITAQIQPAVDAITVPDSLNAKQGRIIEFGALAYLLDLPGEKWTNLVRADLYRKQFQSGINNAKADEQRGYNSGAIRAKPRLLFIPRRC